MESEYVTQSLPPAYIVSILIRHAGDSMSACYYMHMQNRANSSDSLAVLQRIAKMLFTSLQERKLQAALHTLETSQLALHLEKLHTRPDQM